MSRQLRSGKTVNTSTIVPKRVYNKTVKRNEMEEDDVLDASLATEPKAKSSFYSDILFIYSLY